jgi:3-hydroxyisobutyrate dehydrogenase-like beta-hydroxyacid dehydrogenase
MIRTVGILSPGDMGGAIGRALAQGGLRAVAALDERSERTRRLAAEAGLEDVGSVERMVSVADAVLSVLVPAEATEAAERVARALRAADRDPGAAPLLYADLNAIAPATTRRVGEIVEAAGARYVDGGIIGLPPRTPGATRIYLSGPQAGRLLPLRETGLDMRVVGEEIGQASGLKMCYAALTKGLTALGTELLVTASRLGLEEPLRAELEGSQAALLGWLAKSVPSMPPKAHRWVGEMEEIAATFEAVGLTPRTLLGAADMYRWIAETDLGRETPETRDATRDLDATVAALAEDAGARVG